MKKSNNSLDLQVILSAFHNVLVHVYIWTAIVTIHNVDIQSWVPPLQFFIEDAIDEVIEQYDKGYIREEM